MNKHLIGLGLGLGIGIVDCVIFAASGMALTTAMIMEALLFWTAVGWVIHTVDMNISATLKGGLFSLFLNAPWIIEYVMIQGMSEMLVPMVIVGGLFGLIGGFIFGWIKNRQTSDSSSFAKG